MRLAPANDATVCICAAKITRPVRIDCVLADYYDTPYYTEYECSFPLLDHAVLTATSALRERGPQNARLNGKCAPIVLQFAIHIHIRASQTYTRIHTHTHTNTHGCFTITHEHTRAHAPNNVIITRVRQHPFIVQS